MVSYYDRLKALKNLNVKPLESGDFQEDSRSGNAHTAVTEVKDKGEDFQNDASRGQSQTKVGADGWMKRFVDDSDEHMNNIEASKAHHLSLREAMSNRIAESSNLSDSLLNSSDYAKAQENPPLRLTVDGDGSVVYTDGPSYLAALESQRYAKREEAAKAILDQLNQEGHEEAGSFDQYKEDYVPEAWQPQPEPQPTPTPGGGGGGGYGRRSGGGGVGGGAVGAGSGVLSVGSATGLSSAITEWKAPAAGEPGSLSNPITDPSQLSHIDLTTTPVNQRMTPNGPTPGHMPADVLNANDPAWRATPPVGGSVARIAGGTLVAGTAAGVGGLAAARGGGFSGIGGLATGSSGSALRSVAPAGGVLRPSTMPGGAAGVAGRGGVGGAGMRSGMAPVGSSGSGGAGSRGGAGVAGRGGVGAAGRGGVVGTGGQSGARSAGVAGRGGAGAAGRGGAAGREGGAGSARGGASGVAGRGGAGAGRAGAGAGRAGAGGRGGAGVAGRGGAGGRGVLGGGSSAGRGEKKKETQRRNYDVVRIDGIEEQSTGLVGGAAGSADQLKPLSRDSGEDW